MMRRRKEGGGGEREGGERERRLGLRCVYTHTHTLLILKL